MVDKKRLQKLAVSWFIRANRMCGYSTEYQNGAKDNLRGCAAELQNVIQEPVETVVDSIIPEMKALGLELGRRLTGIAQIIENVDQRCMAADGPVTPILQEMTQDEISEIYRLAR